MNVFVLTLLCPDDMLNISQTMDFCRPYKVVALPWFIDKWPSFGCKARIRPEANTDKHA